jgi:hypothetical protein
MLEQNHVGQSNGSRLNSIIPQPHPHAAADTPWLDVRPALLSSARELKRVLRLGAQTESTASKC